MIRKFSTTDGFVAIDIAGAPATGIVRAAPKILQGGASELARSASYTFAAFGIARSGASAGINAAPDQVDVACRAVADELAPDAVSGDLLLIAAKGTDAEALASLGSPHATPAATVAGVVAATEWALAGLDGKKVAIEGTGDLVDLLAAALAEAGATLVTVDGADKKPWLIWGADADAVLAGSKPGALTHQGGALVKAKAIVPWGPIPVTTKAFAGLKAAGVDVLPDFISANGALLAPQLADSSPAGVAGQVKDLLDAVGRGGDGMLLNACYQAEVFLATWTDQRLFGRPLAS
ncbi:MAG: hypothetical protein O3C27_07755 [Actinomycetota bacterium]|nr:hypothetical protein [Actinomycetota bacterium]